jgi:predicted phage baseplate assembly protein
VHYAFVNVGRLTRQHDTAFSPSSDLVVAPVSGTKLEMPVDGSAPSAFVLQDVNEISVQGNGNVDFDSGELDFQAADWSQSLTPPVNVFGNVLQSSRGETVSDEILGSGDATQPNQTFKLKKSPLTYVAAPSAEDERGVKTTLKIWMDGIQWQEVSSFYGQGPNHEVYSVRQNDDQETLITFGDGRRGRRLPTGTDNVVASYRFGAGAAAPPANSITQLAKPIKGLTAVNNPFAANGGDDAQDADGIRGYAPQAALLLGRAVSLQDFIAATAGMPGVQAVHAQWRWNNQRQRPVIQIWYIGGGDSQKITASLRKLADPAIALDVTKAGSVPLTLSFDVEVGERVVEDDVLADIRSALTDPDAGMLSVKNIGIGQPLYRSQLLAAILAVPGTVAVTYSQHDETPFDAMAVKPDPGKYFDVAAGALIINGRQGF